MSRTSLSQKILGLTFILAGTPLFADATGMKKDEWLSNLKTIAPGIICKGFFDDAGLKQRLEEASISQDRCLTLIPTSYDKCQAKYYTQIPDTIDQNNGTRWGRTIGECIGADFMLNNMTPAVAPNTPSTYPQPQNNTPTNPPPAATQSATPEAAQTTSATTTQPATPTVTQTPPPAETTPNPGQNLVQKDAWLISLGTTAPEMICKGFLNDTYLKDKFAEKSIDMQKCMALLPASFDACKLDLYAQIPKLLTTEQTSQWGYKLGECIGGDFVKKHLLGEAPAQAPAFTPAQR